jgi:hypothetical protein
MVDRSDILRSRDIIRDHFDNVLRMMDDVDKGKPGHTSGTVDLTCHGLASALKTAGIDADTIRNAYRQRVPAPLVRLPLAARLSPRPGIRTGVPVTVSPAGCA